MMERVRILYAKTEPLRYTGNLDMHKVWERSLRRAKLPLAYSQGFHPQPRINQASPLPLGITSQAEVIDFWLDDELPVNEVQAMIEKAVPPGIEIRGIQTADLRDPALQTQVLASVYRASLPASLTKEEIDQRVQVLMSQDSIQRERRGKQYDLKPLIESIQVMAADSKGRVQVEMRLSAREGKTGRPEEVLSAMDVNPNETRLERIDLLFAGASVPNK